MMKLDTKLQLISEEVDKIVPNKLAKDFTVFGVTGTFQGGTMSQDEYDECLALSYAIINATKLD